MTGSTPQPPGTNRPQSPDAHRLEVTHGERDAYTVDIRGHRIEVDQPLEAGGADTAPTPTELFAASLATCVAFYAGRYLHRHGLPRTGLRVRAEFTMATDRPARVAALHVVVVPPPELPEPRRAPLLAIDAPTSHALLDEVVHGCDGIKPGWTRVNFSYFISDTVRDYLIDAVGLVATYGHRLLPDYRFDPHTGQWRHRSGPAEPPLRLTDVRFGTDGRIIAPTVAHHRLGEEALAGQLARAREVLTTRPDRPDDRPTGLPADFERMRWFPLPRVCLEQTRPGVC